MKIGIIGSGQVGIALAVFLMRADKDVLIFCDDQHLGVLKKNRNNISVKGLIEGDFKLNTTNDIKTFAMNVSIVFVVTPSYAHNHVYKNFIVHLLPNTVVVNITGNFSSLLYEDNYGRDKILADITLSPIGVRYKNSILDIICTKKTVMVASTTETKTETVYSKIRDLLPCQLTLGDPIQSGLTNVAGICHPGLLIFNAGRIGADEEDFYFNKDGITPEIAKLLTALDNERMQLLDRLGYPAKDLTLVMDEYYDEKFTTIYDFFKGSSVLNAQMICPKSMYGRYLEEDIPFVLIPWLQLAKKLGTDHLAIQTLISSACLLTGKDYFSEAINIAEFIN